MEFKLNADKSLSLLQNNQWKQVELKCCFPDSHPDMYFSVMDEKKKEVTLIESLKELDELNQKILAEYLETKNFVLEIIGIYDIREEFGVRHFEVQTKSGKRSFQTELDIWPEQKGAYTLINDIYGDQYQIQQLEFGSEILARYC